MKKLNKKFLNLFEVQFKEFDKINLKIISVN